MKNKIIQKIAQLQYEISNLGLDEEELTGVSIRTEELKDLVKSLLPNSCEQLKDKDKPTFEGWVKDKFTYVTSQCWQKEGKLYSTERVYEIYKEAIKPNL
jgi:hypothetical protein